MTGPAPGTSHPSSPLPEGAGDASEPASSSPTPEAPSKAAEQRAERKRPVETAARLYRKASREETVARLKQRQRELEAYRVGLIRIRERALPMKLSRVEQVPDGSRMVFYFTAEGRIDFRELVRELASEFRTRIEMRQIGVRDEARMLGGYGSCGRLLCCSAWLQSFEPVSIKMAKQQDLSLNPSRLSGLCGRLKCCLRYEMKDCKQPRGQAKECGRAEADHADEDVI
jgi:cell fate regulator YaaT (PSP1 superfamily)